VDSFQTPANGVFTKLTIGGRPGYVIRPAGKVDGLRRWVLVTPSWVAEPPPKGEDRFYYREYSEALLARGFCLVGVDVGVACGNPTAISAFQDAYDTATRALGLSERVRLFATSNGGMNAYNWAVRHAELVDRILAIYPVTDIRTWPGLRRACGDEPWAEAPAPYEGMTVDQLAARLGEINPINKLDAVARNRTPVLHIHGSADDVVPLAENSRRFIDRLVSLGGLGELQVVPGAGHGGDWVTTMPCVVGFLAGD
jgi:pimeloyl-ACP methyl ester carboxylesterase